MSSIAIRPEAGGWRAELSRTGAALRQYRWHHAGLATVIALLLFAISLPGALEGSNKYGWHAGMFWAIAVAPLLGAHLSVLAWVIVDAGGGERRLMRLSVALIVAGLLASALTGAYWYASGAEAFEAQIAAERGKHAAPGGVMFLTNFLITMIYGGLFFTVMELVRRRKRTQAEFQDVMRRQARVAQHVLESRLAAMQAQVEPRFLFDSLVDIEALYAKDAPAAADLLDRLISYLRAALPKLREQGSTIGAEIELLKAYISVVNALNDGRPRLIVTLAEDCSEIRFYPMLLLPLVQRAVRGTALPESLRLGVSRAGNEVAIVLRIAATGGCSEDAELTRVRQRLAGLYGKAATLDCSEPGQHTTQFTLRFTPHPPASTRS
jgi:hypothetical protein